ncbi:MAG: hypothetical protein JW910_07425 [Anaerolineae bacterium]|nr:hypothetical protein [Anaerolineae bacterium]
MTMTDVYLEIGEKKVLAGAVEWPGWQRGGRDEALALQALFDYAPRYEAVMRLAGLVFQPPQDLTAVRVVERLDGNSSTDFGVPGRAPAADDRPLDDAGLAGLRRFLEACWAAFDRAASAAVGKELRKGPRGGGRDLDKIIWHVVGAEAGYLGKLGVKIKVDESGDQRTEQARVREAILSALDLDVLAQLPPTGPRGGARWSARYFVRRTAWHDLDHAWEIEDRIL